MDQKTFVKSLLGYNKTAFDQFLSASNMAQEQMEKLAEILFLQESTPEESRKMVEDWLGNLRQGRKDIQESLENSFRQLETYMLSLIP
ncbi:hypothetical protein [Desulfobotulus sp.]|jgi:hypothetical protein|uniref:hypothetical protein n=1 Tax=Desulfobotulus sp. TaxID=1940337 RepID=UPI002A36B955|nr:hypothetical protein [Desulfobotulus sp.]MDY0162989.1 hypothetical protein [Desulfobotulus sp.]